MRHELLIAENGIEIGSVVSEIRVVTGRQTERSHKGVSPLKKQRISL